MEFTAEVMNSQGEIKVTGGGGAGYPFDVLTVDGQGATWSGPDL
jgi:hypothetical protein